MRKRDIIKFLWAPTIKKTAKDNLSKLKIDHVVETRNPSNFSVIWTGEMTDGFFRITYSTGIFFMEVSEKEHPLKTGQISPIMVAKIEGLDSIIEEFNKSSFRGSKLTLTHPDLLKLKKWYNNISFEQISKFLKMKKKYKQIYKDNFYEISIDRDNQIGNYTSKC